MKRCKNCGATSDLYECMTIEASGPVFGKHSWKTINESVGGAPGPDHWMNYDSSTPKQIPRDGGPSRSLNETTPPANYMTETQPNRGQSTGRANTTPRNFSQAITSQQLLAQVQAPTGNPLNATAPGHRGSPMNAQIGNAPKPFMSWHSKIIAECAPICRKLKETEPKKQSTLPADVRSRGPRR